MPSAANSGFSVIADMVVIFFFGFGGGRGGTLFDDAANAAAAAAADCAGVTVLSETPFVFGLLLLLLLRLDVLILEIKLLLIAFALTIIGCGSIDLLNSSSVSSFMPLNSPPFGNICCCCSCISS